jgi:hypothetical protein
MLKSVTTAGHSTSAVFWMEGNERPGERWYLRRRQDCSNLYYKILSFVDKGIRSKFAGPDQICSLLEMGFLVRAKMLWVRQHSSFVWDAKFCRLMTGPSENPPIPDSNGLIFSHETDEIGVSPAG